MIRAIGIDLGTTNTVAAMMKRGEPKEIHNRRGGYITPSAVALGRRGELLVGEDAKTRGSGVVMSFKRDMGTDTKIQFNNRTYTPMEMSALVLRQVKKDVEDVQGEPVSRAVITVPAWFSERAIVETREAGRLAGFFVLRTFSEPMAAALAYGIDREDTEPKTIMVYDLGGGTFDISVLMLTLGSFAAMDHEGDVYLGGDDFDQLIVDYIRDKARKEQRIEIPDDPASRFKIKLAAEQAKKDLSSMDSANIALPALGGVGITFELEITRQAFDNMLMPWLVGSRTDGKKATKDLVQIAIQKSNLSPDLIDNILLVGGSTYIPLVREVLSQEFGEKKILKSVNPMLCVAHGAAIETNLIPEIDCPQCHQINPLDAMKCEKCGYSLVGEEKIDCPVCFLPSPVTERTCWKCGSEIRSRGRGLSPQYKKCPQGHENALNATVCSKCPHVFEAGGIRCGVCGRLIKEGEIKCECGATKPQRNEVTSKDKGIELNDGQFDVIVPKGTEYPTEAPLHALYSIPRDNALQLEITVWEGEDKVASKNEWLGALVMELPPALPKGTPVDISISLDKDSSMMVSARLVEKPLIAVRARIERIKGSVEILKELEKLLKKARELAKKGEEYLSKDQRKQLQALIAEIEEVKKKQDSSLIDRRRAEWEKNLAGYEAEIEVRSNIQGRINQAGFTCARASEYMDDNDQRKVKSLMQDTQKALSSDDLEAAKRKSKELEAALNSLGNVNLVVYAEALAGNPNLSSSLSSGIYRTLQELRDAVRSRNNDGISQKLSELDQLLDQALIELKDKGIEEEGPTKPGKSDRKWGRLT